MFSVPHMIVLFIVVLVVFGPHKLPELARGLGKLMAEFRKASTDFKLAFEEEMRNVERQAREAERKKQMDAAAASAATAEPSPATATATGSDDSALPQIAETIEPVISPVSESVARGSEEAGSTDNLDATEKETSSGQKLQEKALNEPLHDSLHDEGQGHPA
ncbi:MAG TPA: twin-arginine translocase TatA/TatE family subunit [Candidatus Acidoferrum sp.]|nr:twin-arginine translocase TatA/TatE family subunit [Candidatus Acidoferrum sp.]